MKVLWVFGEVPIPADSGARLRILGLLRPLAARHEVTAAVLDPGPAGRESLCELERICSAVAILPWRGRARGLGMVAGAALNLLSSLPYSVARYCTADTERRLAELAAGRFDIIQCDNIGFHRYLRSPASAPRVLGTHNVEADVWRQRARLCRNPLLSTYLARQAVKMSRYEGALARSYDWVTAVSESDAARFRTDYGVPNVTVVPNGVDTDYFTPTAEPPQPGLVVFTGSMDYAPNDDAVRYFLKDIWPLVRRQFPTARFLAVGRRPSPALRALAERAARVEVTGWVPDIRPYLARAGVIVAPLRMGGGSRLKILEAMAMGRPVVSTTVGAEGLDLEPSRHLLVADNPAAFAEETACLLKAEGFAASIARNGKHVVASHHSWLRLCLRLEHAWKLARETTASGADFPRRLVRQAEKVPGCRSCQSAAAGIWRASDAIRRT